MMKTFIYMSILLALVTSCSNFLDLSPESNTSEATFFKTQSDFQQALEGNYSALRLPLTGSELAGGYIMGEMRSDNTHYSIGGPNHGIRPFDVDNFTDDAQNTITNRMYDYCYIGISRSNAILRHLKEVSFPEDFMNSIEGQTKFLRAYNYFLLVQYYGSVPLQLDQVSDADAAFLPQSSVDEVYTQIISDLTDAIAKMKAPVFPQTGKASQGSARLLMAKVLMTKPTRNYAGAEAQLRAIMTMGYSLLPNYSDVYELTNKNSVESLFEIQYQEGNQSQNSNFLYYFMPRTKCGDVLTGVAGTNNSTWAGFNVPTQDLIDSYEPGDLRLDASIRVAVGVTQTLGGIDTIQNVLTVGDPSIANYQTAICVINKYRHAHLKVWNTDDNWPIYRYSDVLLSLAECLTFENKNPSEAAQLVSEVRNRAGLSPVNTVDEDYILNERRHEFAFENQRWLDLVRTGKALSVMTAFGEKMKATHSYLNANTYQVTPERLIFPIPFREMQLNSKLVQNPGY